jgi:HTH-like domain
MERQGPDPGIERMCALAGVSRTGYYRHWLEAKPRREETALRDVIQRLSLAERKNGYRDGYRLITIQLQRMGWAVNHKRVARIRREDNLLCVPKQSLALVAIDVGGESCSGLIGGTGHPISFLADQRSSLRALRPAQRALRRKMCAANRTGAAQSDPIFPPSGIA